MITLKTYGETKMSLFTKRISFGLLMTLFSVGVAFAEDTSTPSQDETQFIESETIDTDKVETPVFITNWEKPIPLTLSIDYTLVSDYIWRGINLSDASRKNGATHNEGRRWPNQQMTTGAELDLGKFGRVGGSLWFEWYCGQEYMTPDDGDKTLQEIDYTVYYGYTIEQIGLDIELGFIWYEFPRARSDADSTQELYTKLSYDDSKLFRMLGLDVKEPVLNPYLFIAWDLDLARGGSYYEFGLSHDFVLQDLGMKDLPLLKNMTVTPAWSMSWDHNWLQKMSLDPSKGGADNATGFSNSSHLANMVWGLQCSYDLKSALNIPDKYCGDFSVNTFMNYSHAIARHLLDDELWGGVSVGYSW